MMHYLSTSKGKVSVYSFVLFLGDDDEIPQELLLGKHQLSELGSESAKIKAMGIMDRVSYCLLKNEDIANVYKRLL